MCLTRGVCGAVDAPRSPEPELDEGKWKAHVAKAAAVLGKVEQTGALFAGAHEVLARQLASFQKLVAQLERAAPPGKMRRWWNSRCACMHV